MGDFRPLKPAKRAATFVWDGKVFEINLDGKTMNCPRCGMRFYLPHNLVTEQGGTLATVSPSVVCPEQHGGCGWHVVINAGNAV